MRVSHVVKTAEEVKAEMKDANASNAEISAAIDQMSENEKAVQDAYRKIGSRFDASLMRQNQ